MALGTLLRDDLRRGARPLGSPLAALVSQVIQWRGGFSLHTAALLKFARGVTTPVPCVQSNFSANSGEVQ